MTRLTESSLTAALRHDTRAAHERVEATLEPLTTAPTLASYGELLSLWRAFFAYWEPAMLEVLPADLRGDFAARRKTEWLDQDLQALGSSSVKFHFEPHRLPVQMPADALGGIYVVEGSTLGGQVLCKRIGDALALTPERGLRYFSSYGPQTAARWRETKHLLDDPRWHDQRERIVDAASRTFEALTRFFTERPALSPPARSH